MENKKQYRGSISRDLNGLIPADIIKKKNDERAWFWGYHKAYDVIVISHDGTIGDIVEVGELNIALPAKPNKLRNQSLQAKHQKWERIEVPYDLMHFDTIYGESDDMQKSIEDVYGKHADFIEKDHKRIREGDWVMVDGDATYITGGYYFFLQHYKLKDTNEYPFFRTTQKDYFLFLEACRADNRCLGSLLLKSRRSSFTVTAASEIIRSAITTKNSFHPIVSKTNGDAESLFRDHIVTPILTLPKHLQPERGGNVMPKDEIHFTSSQRKLTANKKTSNSDLGLNSIIKTYPSTLDAYDGKRSTLSINDEIGKLKGELDINIYWHQAHKMCHEVGAMVVGKAICGSTANPPNKGGKNYREFYEGSIPLERDELGRTNTGLYAIFIPADFAYTGCFDEYGHPIYYNPETPIKNEFGMMVEMGSKAILDSKESAAKSDSKKYNSQKRNEPRVDTDAFLDEDSQTMFGTPNVVAYNNFVKEFRKSQKYKDKVYKIDLVWKNGERDGDVVHKFNPNGKYHVSWIPPIDQRNQYTMKNGKKTPSNGHMGAFGLDPYRSRKVVSGAGSKQAFVGLTKPYGQGFPTDTFILNYSARGETIEEAADDIIKALVFYSMPILCESNVDKILQIMKDRGYRGYSIQDPTLKRSELKPIDKEFGGMYSSVASIQTQESALESFISRVVHDEVDEDDLKIPFLEITDDWMMYGPDNRTKRDTTIASMLAVIANTKEMAVKKANTDDDYEYEDLLNYFKHN